MSFPYFIFKNIDKHIEFIYPMPFDKSIEAQSHKQTLYKSVI
jgi:hypothetical protein